MVGEIIKKTFRQTNLSNESDEYLSRREELRLAEIELMRQRERVAELRRQLPQGAAVEDYNFLEGPAHLEGGDAPTRTVRLSELFSGPNRSLVIYHFMYGKAQTQPCPMCTAWIDCINGIARHLTQTMGRPEDQRLENQHVQGSLDHLGLERGFASWHVFVSMID